MNEGTMLKGGIIGLGRMGITHFSILNSHPCVEFIAACEPKRFILKNLREYLTIDMFTDYQKMIDASDLDFVIVATPTSSHADIVKYAILNNLHVFAEKPFVLNPQQGQEIIEILKDKELVNQVGYVNRFNEVFVKVKGLLDEGLLGDLCHFKLEMNVATVLRMSRKSWRTQGTEGGGCLHDFASHGIDLINYLIGSPDKIIGSVLQKVYSADVEDAVYSTFVYHSGFSGHLLVNWSDASYRKHAYKIQVFGKKGKIIADQHMYKLYLRDTEEASEFDKGWNTQYLTDFAQPVRFYVRGNEFTKQLDYFIECIMNKTIENRSSFADGLITDRIIKRIRENAQQEG